MAAKNNRLVVAVRIRPISQKELAKDNVTVTCRALDDHTVHTNDPFDEFNEDVLRKDRTKEKIYTFDSVFSETAPQIEIFKRTTKPVVNAVIEGYNATVFAYGATGAGKTYTMLGNDASPGIMPLTLVDLFAQVNSKSESDPEGRWDITLSYLEIYNENIRDLLSGKQEYLELRDDGVKGVVVSGIKTVNVESAEEVLDFLRIGNLCRTCEATGANEVSSRSHAVLQVLVTHKDMSLKGRQTEKFAKLSMIDLAGSERAAETNNRGIRMIEGANINRSLLALGNCINALGADGKKAKYVNFRDSKLTRLLKDSLGGNCKTVMIANISPASVHFDESQNTLKYACRARNIKNSLTQQITVKFDPYVAAFSQLQTEVGDMRYQAKSRHDRRIPQQQQTHKRPCTKGSEELDRLTETFENLFAEHLRAQAELIDYDEGLHRNGQVLMRLKERLGKIERRLGKNPDGNQKLDGLRNETLTVLEGEKNERKRLSGGRNEAFKSIQSLDEKIQLILQNIPSSVNSIEKKYLTLLAKGHQWEIENRVLATNLTRATTTLNEREALLNTLQAQFTTLEKIVHCQQNLLKQNDILPTPQLQTLFSNYDAQKQDSKELARSRASESKRVSRMERFNKRISRTDGEDVPPALPEKAVTPKGILKAKSYQETEDYMGRGDRDNRGGRPKEEEH